MRNTKHQLTNDSFGISWIGYCDLIVICVLLFGLYNSFFEGITTIAVVINMFRLLGFLTEENVLCNRLKLLQT